MTLQGAKRTYELEVLTTNMSCRLEALTDRPYGEVLKELRQPRSKRATVRAFLAAALIDPPDLPVDAVEPILRDIGGPSVIRAAMRRKRVTRG